MPEQVEIEAKGVCAHARTRGRTECTSYEDPPSACGTALVTPPALACSDPSSSVDIVVVPRRDQVCDEYEEAFRAELSPRRIARLYRGALPRMVLVALEAWSRRDYTTFLAERAQPASTRLDWTMGPA